MTASRQTANAAATPHESARQLLDAAAARLELAGVELPRFEAQLLLGLATGATRTQVLAGTEPELTHASRERFDALLRARIERTPLAYLRGSQEFYGLTFEVNPSVLIPRPESEMLVDFARERLAACESGEPLQIVDVGAGSGCVGIAIAASEPRASVLSIDLSALALAVAMRNALRLGAAERVRFIQSSGLSAVADGAARLVVANLPYIATDQLETLQPEVRGYEPRLALDGGLDGLTIVRAVAGEARRVLGDASAIALEVAAGQAPAVCNLLRTLGYADVAARRDLAGIERLVTGTAPGAGIEGNLCSWT